LVDTVVSVGNTEVIYCQKLSLRMLVILHFSRPGRAQVTPWSW